MGMKWLKIYKTLSAWFYHRYFSKNVLKIGMDVSTLTDDRCHYYALNNHQVSPILPLEHFKNPCSLLLLHSHTPWLMHKGTAKHLSLPHASWVGLSLPICPIAIPFHSPGSSFSGCLLFTLYHNLSLDYRLFQRRSHHPLWIISIPNSSCYKERARWSCVELVAACCVPGAMCWCTHRVLFNPTQISA